jgi:serpin B
MGATGETALQLSSMLRLEHLSKDAMANNYASAISYLPVSLAGFKVSAQIFHSKRQKLKSEFLETAANQFFTEVERVNFSKSVNCFGKINDWIVANLPRKMPGMVDSNTISADTSLLLASVCYFRGSWLHPFTLSLTTKQPFWVTPNESVTTNMMNITERFLFSECEELDAKAIELPYKGSEVTMVLLLPNNQNTLENLEASLDSINLLELMGQMTEQFVNLSLPRFKLEAGYCLQRKFLEV